MSNQAWAIEQMMKHRLQVDFSRRMIECRGYHNFWIWDFKEGGIDFYTALQTAITDIGAMNEN